MKEDPNQSAPEDRRCPVGCNAYNYTGYCSHTYPPSEKDQECGVPIHASDGSRCAEPKPCQWHDVKMPEGVALLHPCLPDTKDDLNGVVGSWEQEFDDAVGKHFNGGNPYWPEWGVVKSFIKGVEARAYESGHDASHLECGCIAAAVAEQQKRIRDDLIGIADSGELEDLRREVERYFPRES